MFMHAKGLRAGIRLLMAVSLLAVLGLILAPARAAFAASHTVCAAGCDFTTIQAAVTASAPGDTILVRAGTYPETVLVNKQLTIDGANAGVNPNSGTRTAESIVGAANGGFVLQANGVIVDGFTVQGASSPPPPGFGAGIAMDHTTSGNTVRNNIVQNNIIGVYVNGAGQTITNNLIRNNNNAGSAGGSGIYSDQGLSTSTISGNTFTGQTNASILLGFVTGAPNTALLIDSNTITNDAPVLLYNTQSSTFSNNKLTGSAGSGVFIGDGSMNLQVKSNYIQTSAFSALRFGNNAGGPAASGVSVLGNALITSNDYGIKIGGTGNGEPNSYTGAMEVHENNIYGNKTGGIINYSSAATVNAQDNFFGCNTGPNTTGCDTVTSAGGPVNVGTYLVLRATISGSTVTADLRYNNAGTFTPPLYGGVTIPNGKPVTFAATCGTVTPTNTTFTNGTATATFTPPAGNSSCQVSATVENATAIATKQGGTGFVQIVAKNAINPTVDLYAKTSSLAGHSFYTTSTFSCKQYTAFTSVSAGGKRATLTGVCTLSTTGMNVTFRIDLVQTGGFNGTYHIHLSNGYDSGVIPIGEVKIT